MKKLTIYSSLLWTAACFTMSKQQVISEVSSINRNFEIAQCLNKYFKLYAPSVVLQKKLQAIFGGHNFFEQLELQADPRAWLQSRGFKIIQFQNTSPFDPAVIEHESIPGYVIKFMRINAPLFKKTKRKAVKIIPKMSDRVVHARLLKNKIKKMGFVHVAIPDKYFMCIDNLAIVLAQKIVPTRKLQDLNGQEIDELLRLVSAARGILDLRPRNMLITNDKIFLIDTEKKINPLWWSDEVKRKDWQSFISSINPIYLPIARHWAEKQDKKESARLK